MGSDIHGIWTNITCIGSSRGMVVACMVSLLYLGFMLEGASASCRKARLCCPGKTPSCKTQGYKVGSLPGQIGGGNSPNYYNYQNYNNYNSYNHHNSSGYHAWNSLTSNQASWSNHGYNNHLNNNNNKRVLTVCYCDAYCGKIGDCCEDHSRTCPPVDCVAGHWQAWGPCSEQCGKAGNRQRTRPVRRQARNGGKACTQLTQKQFCLGTSCKRARHSLGFESKETGYVIPAKFGTQREKVVYHPFKDIRRNLFNKYNKDMDIKRPSYCAYFRITKSSPYCQSRPEQPWARALGLGATVCVECQTTAMKRSLGVRCRGHGVYRKSTHWNALRAHGCHGRWVMTTKHRYCTCDPASSYSFILV